MALLLLNRTHYNCILYIKINVLYFKSDKRIKQTTELSLLPTKKDQKFHSVHSFLLNRNWKWNSEIFSIFEYLFRLKEMEMCRSFLLLLFRLMEKNVHFEQHNIKGEKSFKWNFCDNFCLNLCIPVTIPRIRVFSSMTLALALIFRD